MSAQEKIGVLSLGCPRNLTDTESILGRLRAKGYAIAELDQADVALVNTCAFIEDAKRESIDAILDLAELKKAGKLKKIIVYGCLSQRYKDTLRKELPEVDAFVGSISLNHETRNYPLTPAHFAYLKICEGCVNKCSYCVIPNIKGKFSSIDIPALLAKVEKLNRENIRELNIIGQDLTGYGRDLYGVNSLSRLLREIIKQSSRINWIRLLYLNPERVDDELLALIKDEPRMCKYIDLPIQHINSRLLKLMRRGSSRGQIERLIAKIRKDIPGAAIRTSVIVGFPSETDKEFKELLKFIEEVKFERLGAFIYSREEGTPAYDFKGHLPEKARQERFNLIMQKQQEISAQVNRAFLGKTLEVLIEEQEGDCYVGRSQFDAPEVDGSVYVRSEKKLNPGDMVRARITDTLEYDLTGEAVL